MSELELKNKLQELGFVSNPDLPGKPDFANFKGKMALTVTSRLEYDSLDLDQRVEFNLAFRERFADLKSKRWYCGTVYLDDDVEKTINRIKSSMTQREISKVKLPPGPESTTKKLIEMLKRTDEELLSEQRKRKRNYPLVWGLKDRRKSLENRLHALFKPVILERDNHQCRACGSTENLELARLSGGDMARPERINRRRTIWHYPDVEKRWAEENMLILCEKCHKTFDSLNARFWRRSLGTSSVEQAVELITTGKLREFPPIPQPTLQFFKYRGILTFFKVLRKAVIFYRKDNTKKARLYLGNIKREWSYLGRRNALLNKGNEQVERYLQVIYSLTSKEEVAKAEQAIRNTVLEHLENDVQPEVLSRFKEALLKQDNDLLKL